MLGVALAWFTAGAITFVVCLYVHLQRVSDRLGSAIGNVTRRQVQTMGGGWSLFWTIVLISFLLPPVTLTTCLISYWRDWQVFKREDEQSASN